MKTSCLPALCTFTVPILCSTNINTSRVCWVLLKQIMIMMIISGEALTPLPALDKGKSYVGLAEFWRINSVFWNRFFCFFFIITIKYLHVIWSFYSLMTVDWTMLVMILVIRIIIVFIPITTESSSTLFCRIIKVDWMIIRIIVFFITRIIINWNSSDRWSAWE